MSRQAWISFLGLYNWDNTLFDNMTVPNGFTSDDKNTLINNLLMETAELEVLYPDPDFMKSAITTWSAMEVLNWDRIYQAMLADYNPIENYNRTEHRDSQNRGTIQKSGKDTLQRSYSDSTINSITSFDNNSYSPHDKSLFSGGTTDDTIYGNTVTDKTGQHIISKISGNIGVTTSQQMLEQEIEVTPKLNIFHYIIDSFKNRFCLLVY